MKRIILLIMLLGLLSFSTVFAYEINIQSVTDSELVLAVSGLNNVDIKFSDLKATVDTATVSDTYYVDKKLSIEDNKILVTIDITPLKEDYSDIDSITVSGFIEVDGVKEEFAKRASYRDSGVVFSAPELNSSELIYWIIGIVLLIVVFALLFVTRKPKKKAKRRKKSKKKKI